MSFNDSLSAIKCQSDECEIITLTTTTGSPVITVLSSSIADSPSTINEFTTERICRLLKTDPDNYKVVKNVKSNLTSVCWKVFGLPGHKTLAKEEFEPIPGFVSCESCFQTYAFTYNSGTRVLNAHICVQKLGAGARKRSVSESVTGHQLTLATAMKCYKQVKLPEKQINKIKEITCKWLCEDMRSFSIVEDIGLKNILQEFIVIGATYGIIDDNAFRGADVIAKHIYQLADDYRAELKELLKEPYENKCICVCPDMWSDPYKQISYMGISISFTDENYFYKSIDICCRPYVQNDHTSENILMSIRQCLEPFGLIDFGKLQFVSDRGPNLVCALRNYNTLFCYPHRLNNILKCSFFQSQTKEKKQISSTTSEHTNSTNTTMSTSTTHLALNEEDDNYVSSSDDDDDDEKSQPTLPIKNKRVDKSKSSVTKHNNDPRKLRLNDLHPSAQKIIKTITQCKNLVRFVKKSGCNKDIQSLGGIALQQSTVVRWLSLSNLLESIVHSFKATKRVLINRKQHSKLNGIDEETLEQLIRLLKPFKRVLKIIQTSNAPSLYLVLICTLMLRKSLASFDELIKFLQSESSTNTFTNTENVNTDETGDIIENKGMKILRERLLELLNIMFKLDIRHYTSTVLHPRYRQLRDCTKNECEQTYAYIRKCMSEIMKQDQKQQQQDLQQPQKKPKLQQSFLHQYEDDSDYEGLIDEFDTSASENYAFNVPKVDELTRYLSMEIDKSTLTDNPLDFWRTSQTDFPVLSKLARRIHSIPASSAAVERQFSGAGFVVNERRTALDPNQVDNILFIRSMEKMKRTQ